jgi:hypothetical protein
LRARAPPGHPRRVRRSRRLEALALALLLAVSGCRRAPRTVPAAEAVAERSRRGLEELVQAAAQGPLVPMADVLVVVDQSLLQGLLASAVPYEREVSRFRVRVTAAQVRLEDGFALVQLDGRASLKEGPEGVAFADVTAFGALDVVQLDPTSGILRGEVSIIAVDARRVRVLGVGAPAETERLLEELGRERLESFGALASDLEIPVRLERSITMPGLGPEGGVRIAPASAPLAVAVRQVRSLRGKLWVSLDVRVGSAEAGS